MADISDEFKEEMRLAFDLFDSDHSGQVSRQEFHELMESMCKKNRREREREGIEKRKRRKEREKKEKRKQQNNIPCWCSTLMIFLFCF